MEPELCHEMVRIQAVAEAIIRIAKDFGSKLPVDEIELDRMYYEDSEEVSSQWRLPVHRDWIELDWWQLRRSQANRIDVTIRCRRFLCGLMLARRSRNRFCITLRYLEGNPAKHPLSGYVLPITLIVAESFADAYKIRQVCVSRPEKSLIPVYVSHGYELSATDKERQKRNSQPRAKLISKTLSQ